MNEEYNNTLCTSVDVARMYGVEKSTVKHWTKKVPQLAQPFPTPVIVGGGNLPMMYLRIDVQAWWDDWQHAKYVASLVPKGPKPSRVREKETRNVAKRDAVRVAPFVPLKRPSPSGMSFYRASFDESTIRKNAGDGLEAFDAIERTGSGRAHRRYGGDEYTRT